MNNLRQEIREFFSIIESKYRFEIFDITCIITVLNVLLILIGVHWAPLFGILNCFIFIMLNIITRAHINSYITQMALIVLNIYFLTL